MKTLTDDEIKAAIDSLERDGYAVLEQVVPPEPLEQFESALATAFEDDARNGRLFEGGGMVSGHVDCFPGERSRFIYDRVRDARVLEIVEHFAGDRLDELRVTMQYNLPGSHTQHYHPDGLYTEAFLICNVAVVDTDLENGAIDVLPETHQRFYKFWRYTLDRLWKKTTRLPMRRGDILLRISTMWHRGMPNHTETPRPMMSLTFGEESAPDGDPFARNDGEIVFVPKSWYGTDRVSQVREKALVKMPWLYSSGRFARSLVGNKGYSSW